MNRAVGIFEDGVFVPNIHDAKALAGYDKLNDKFFFIDGDDEGRLLVRNMVVDPDTLEWVNQPLSEGSAGGDVTVLNWPASQPVTGPLTDAELRATAVPVSGTFFQATQPVSAASLPLPTGAATSAKQDAVVDEISNKDLMIAVQNLLRVIANPAYVDKSANQLRAQVTGSATVTLASTVISTLNAYAAQLLVIDQNRAAWAAVVRSRIS